MEIFLILLSQGSDFCSTSGFDALVKRMKDGKQMCKDFEDFLKARLKLPLVLGTGDAFRWHVPSLFQRRFFKFLFTFEGQNLKKNTAKDLQSW